MRILIVEDEFKIADVVANRLRKEQIYDKVLSLENEIESNKWYNSRKL